MQNKPRPEAASLDLARVQKLHDAAIAAGLPGVLADGYFIGKSGEFMGLGKPEDHMACPSKAAQAAVAWWLREWCIEHRGVDAFGDPEVRTDIEYLEWAESIVASRKENT